MYSPQLKLYGSVLSLAVTVFITSREETSITTTGMCVYVSVCVCVCVMQERAARLSEKGRMRSRVCVEAAY